MSASDGSFTNRTVNSGEAIRVTPLTNTTYTLVVSYQDPTTVRPSILQTAPVTLSVSVNTPPAIVPDVILDISANTVLRGGSVTLTPTFPTHPDLTIDTATTGIVTGNDESTFIRMSSGASTTITNLQADTPFKLRVTYIDNRYSSHPSYIKTAEQIVSITTGAGTIGTAADMNIARSDFTATPLYNGQVLVCGGVNNATPGVSTVLNSCELYDPFFGTWTATRPMATVRRGHTATLLSSGKVLVAGGYDGTVATTALKTTEIYDPGSRSWSAGTPLIEARTGHTATLLNSGKVLIAGGAVSSGKGTVVELFDPSTLTGIMTATGSLNVARQQHTATLLPNGQVLIAGRNDSEGAPRNTNGDLVDSTTTEIYDDVAGTWSLGPVMNVGRKAHAATLLNPTYSTATTANTVVSKFQVLITGGSGNLASSKAEILTRTVTIATAAVTTGGVTTPAVTTTAWTKGSLITMPEERSFHTSTLLDSGDVLLTGGKNLLLNDVISTDVFKLDTTTFADHSIQKNLNFARSMHRSVKLTSSSVLIMGNYYTTAGTADKKAELWSPQ
ncbi:kelch motif-containing protein [Limnohabitans sp. Jir61]|uniref:Kelch repeat-containing protein n=1 Tax=Limnohabitans sp. Jir61 TaxID=1826168 RepID=UPI001304EF0C|nr:kelch motif-containing protein [Limnohabitans sp. Jir61]